METRRFLRSNILYILWFIFYILFAWLLLGATLIGFAIVVIIYGVSIVIALSPIGEGLLRLIENCREPATEEERRYLMPLFEEVFESAKEINPKLSSKMKLYIMDAMYVNAFAIGRHTIAITRGAISTFTADELKGILAHELGHMNFGHTKALLLSVIGNMFFSLIVWFLRLILRFLQFIANLVSEFNLSAIIFSIIIFIMQWVVEITTFLFINLNQITLALNSRYNETQADTFAYEMGYGRELIASMYILQKISMNADVTIFERLKSSHPHIAQRIGHLERLEDEYIAE